MKTVLLASAAVFALTGIASAATPAVSGKAAHPKHVYVLPHRGATTLWDQSAGTNGIAIVSQNFEATFSIYDANGADDVPAGATAGTINEIIANGTYFNGSGPATSFDVIVYKKIKAKKGKVKAKIAGTCSAQGYTDLSGFGYPDIKLSGCKGKTAEKPKKTWVAVIANLAFSAGGEWGWNTNNTVNGNASLWQNPGGGFSSTGCTSYNTTTTCIPSGEGGDFAYAILQ